MLIQVCVLLVIGLWEPVDAIGARRLCILRCALSDAYSCSTNIIFCVDALKETRTSGANMPSNDEIFNSMKFNGIMLILG